MNAATIIFSNSDSGPWYHIISEDVIAMQATITGWCPKKDIGFGDTLQFRHTNKVFVVKEVEWKDHKGQFPKPELSIGTHFTAICSMAIPAPPADELSVKKTEKKKKEVADEK